MNFLSLKDKFDEFKESYTAGDKLISGVKILGTVVANTAIAAGKVTSAIVEHAEKQKNK